jgi:hypothetical protein
MIVFDMDSSESPTYGEQEGSAYSGHFGCYHPLFVFQPARPCRAVRPAAGQWYSADGWCAIWNRWLPGTWGP